MLDNLTDLPWIPAFLYENRKNAILVFDEIYSVVRKA